ncbi:MAG: hypothetical protein ACOC9B_00555 [Chloroflexota bacterium]
MTLMIVDAAFMSIGLNYFISVVPAVATYEACMERGEVPQTLEDLSTISYDMVCGIWKNRRSWQVARSVAGQLVNYSHDDRSALREWAAQAPVVGWESDPVGKVSGVGITTYQYLRMMGGIDTSMPDKIVRRVIAELLRDAQVELSVNRDLELIDTIDFIARETGHGAIDLCWMTWMVQSEGKLVRMEKYRELLQRI